MTSPAPSARIPAVDIARTLALVGMAVFHTAVDLELFFGRLAPGTTANPGWVAFSVLIAGSFIFLSGVSLHLAHGRGIRWPAFGRRFAILAGAAALVSGATYYAQPEFFVRFGILHSIALSTLVGLAFLRLPAILTIVIAVAIIALPRYVEYPVFDSPWLLWVGLSTTLPGMMDYEPMFPWLGACLLGLATARLMSRFGLWDPLRRATVADAPLIRALAWPGRHSLAVYLLHQPVLIGVIWVLLQV